MRAVMYVWRFLTAIAAVFWFLLAALTGATWLDGFIKGDAFSDASMIQSILPGPSISYADFYSMVLTVFLYTLFALCTCVVSYQYQKAVLRTNRFLPDGKWHMPVIIGILHIIAVVWFILSL